MPEHAEGPNQKRAEKKEQPARAFTPPKVLSEEVSKYAVRQDGILRIIGEGEIGDKARSLNRDAEGYRKAGLYVGERTVLAQSILEDFLRFNGICSTLEEGNFIRDIGKLILDPKAKFPPELEAAIAKEIASFPKSGLNEELLGRLPKTDYTRLEDCELDLDRFKKEAKSGLENADEQLLAPLFEKIKQAASSGDSWGIIKDEVDNGIRWLTTQKKVILNADYCAILTLIDGIEGDKEWMDYRAAHPHTPTFSIFRLNKYSCLCPAMGRSSAKGDDDGTGAYKSESASNSINEVLGAFKGVLASYFSPKAKDLRKKAKTGEGFGIMLEPMAGSILAPKDDYPVYAPLFSGVAEIADGQAPTIAVDFGLGGGVRPGYEVVDVDLMKKSDGDFSKYVEARIKEASGSKVFSSRLIYSLSGNILADKMMVHDYSSDFSYPGKNESEFFFFSFRDKLVRSYNSSDPMGHASNFNFLPFINSLCLAAKNSGPRRIEFAIVLDGGWNSKEAKIHVLQSSAISEEKTATAAILKDSRQLCYLQDNLGDADVKFKKIIKLFFRAGQGIQALYDFDRSAKKGFMAIIPQDLSSNEDDIYLSNACGVISFGENDCFGGTLFNTGDRRHYDASKVLDHFPNFMAKTGRFFASTVSLPPDFNDLPASIIKNGVKIIEPPQGHHFRAIAAGKSGGLRIYLCKDE